LICGNDSVVELEAKAPVLALLELLDLAVQLDRKLERLGVSLQIRDHFIPGGVAVGVPREHHSRQGAVAA
jgi:hypothetical protein